MRDVTISYEVKLPVFEGPLDLLLHLIERQELDITMVSLAQVTDQYLEYIHHLEQRSAANLADFLVVATKLLLIKSRLLLPRPPMPEEDEEGDIGQNLVRQLIEYKKFKEIAAQLSQRQGQGYRAFVGVAKVTVSGKSLDLDDTALESLVAAVKRALQILPPAPPVSGVIPPPTVSIQEKIDLIKSTLRTRQETDFGELIASARSRVEIIVTFLAVLELIKARFLSVRQEKLFGRILLRHEPEWPEAAEEPIEP